MAAMFAGITRVISGKAIEKSITICNDSSSAIIVVLSSDPHAQQGTGVSLGAAISGGNIAVQTQTKKVLMSEFSVLPHEDKNVPVRTNHCYVTVFRQRLDERIDLLVHCEEVPIGKKWRTTDVMPSLRTHEKQFIEHFMKGGDPTHEMDIEEARSIRDAEVRREQENHQRDLEAREHQSRIAREELEHKESLERGRREHESEMKRREADFQLKMEATRAGIAKVEIDNSSGLITPVKSRPNPITPSSSGRKKCPGCDKDYSINNDGTPNANYFKHVKNMHPDLSP